MNIPGGSRVSIWASAFRGDGRALDRGCDADDLPDVEAEFARAYVDTPRFVFSDTLESVPSGVELVRSRARQRWSAV